jgi:hypothetical protein
MVFVGILLFLIGAIAELIDYVRGAWPTSITWILMGLGLLTIAIGLSRAQSAWRRLAVGAFVLFVVTVGLAWFLG